MLNIRAEVKEVEQWLTRIEKQKLPKVVRTVLKRTASHIAYKAMPRAVELEFDRPTSWAKRGFYAYQPRNSDLVAYVNIKDGGSSQPGRGGKGGTPAFNFFKPHITGENRRAKSHERKLRHLGILGSDEYTTPGKDFKLNRFGNVSGAMYSKMLADVQGSDIGIAQGFGQATTKRGRKRFFYHPNLRPRGIYERFGRGGKQIRVALLFIKAPKYRKRFDFHKIAERVAIKRLPAEFRRAMQRELDRG